MILVLNLNASVDRRYMLDTFEKGEVMRARSVENTAGGKGLHVANVLHALGADAVTRVQIESKDKSGMWGTVGASDNIIVASWEALKDSFEFNLSMHE